nr:hypothetical protein [Tanacetum cinerariifolium]
MLNPSLPLHLVLCSSESKPSILPCNLWDCQLGTYGDSGSGYGAVAGRVNPRRLFCLVTCGIASLALMEIVGVGMGLLQAELGTYGDSRSGYGAVAGRVLAP